jgi:PAS domain S-box-containing protein
MPKLRPLRRWLTLQFALVASMPLVVVAALVWLSLLPQMRTDIAVRHQALARAIAGRVAAHLLGADHALKALADYIDAQDPDLARFWIPLMDAQAGNGDVFEAIYIADENRAVHAVGLPQGRRSKREDLIGLDLSRRDFVSEAPLLKKEVWSETFLSTVSSRLAVALAIPMGYRVMIGEITIERLSQFISQLPVEAGLFTMIIDRQGRTIADSRPGFGGRQVDSSIHAILSDELNPGTTTFEMDGKALIGTVVPVEQVGWKVLVAQPYPEAFRLITTTMTMLAASLAISLLLAFAAGWLEARGFSRHFRRYTEQARSIADGDYDQPWPVSSIAELADLAGNLQRMSDAIRQREDEITASESNLRITLDSIGDAVIATDVHGVVTRLNPIAEQLTGWTATEAIGRPLLEVFHIVNAYTRQRVESPVDKVLAEGQIVGLANHTVLIAKDGAEYQIADSGAPIRQADGQTIGVVLVFRDVTEAYLQAQKIRESEQMLTSITTNLPGVVYQFYATADHQYGLRYLSEKAREIFELDFAMEEFFPAFVARIPDDERERFFTSIQAVIAQEAPWHYEGRYIKPSGETIWFQANSIPHRKGSDILFDGLLLDITERKQAENELRKLRNYLANIIDSMPSVLVGVDGEGLVTQWNRHAQITTGMDAGSALGKPLESVYPLLSRKMARVKETILTGKVHKEQKVPRHDQRELRYEDVIIYPLITNGVEGAVIRVDDVTERVRLEEMMVQSEKMLSVGGLAAGMAHEINNPLAGLLQSAMVLENRLLGDLAANHQAAEAVGADMGTIQAYVKARGLGELLDGIRESGNRAATIVRNMLEFARKSDRAFSSHHLGQLLDQTVELAASDYDLKKNYDFKRIQIIREYATDLPEVPCDKSKIQQVLLNLLKNGAQAMTAQGTGDGQPPRFILRTRRDGDMARIEIEDNGAGMDEATRKRVFEPFFTTKPVNQGTGLGLSVSYFIITEDHNGTLSLSSAEHQGTIFTIRLPLAGRDPL